MFNVDPEHRLVVLQYSHMGKMKKAGCKGRSMLCGRLQQDVSLVIDGSDSYQQLHFSKMFTHTHNVSQLHMGTLKIKTKRPVWTFLFYCQQNLVPERKFSGTNYKKFLWLSCIPYALYKFCLSFGMEPLFGRLFCLAYEIASKFAS